MTCELLKGYRALDLTDDKGALCGKIMADLGADVIKVEPPAGCATRTIPPFLEDRPGQDRSLYFIAYEAGKRSITLNLESAEGRGLFADLAAHADFLVESHPVGYLDSLGLGYETLAKRNPRLIHTSITPFGDTGPGKDYKAADIVTWAAGGMMYMMGEEGRPPLQMSAPQAGLHAGAEAAVASLIAHYARGSSGEGQRVLINMQACIVWTLMNEQAMPILHGDHLRRSGVYVGSMGIRRKMVFRCRDGYISTLLTGISLKALIDWMAEMGFAPESMVKKDWLSWTPGIFMKASEQDRLEAAGLEEAVERFFMTMTKGEIYAQTLRRRLLLAPVSTVADIAADEQLRAREFFMPVMHENLGRTLTFPGPFAKMSLTPIGTPRRAPQLGEHNEEVLGEILGLGRSRIAELRAAAVL